MLILGVDPARGYAVVKDREVIEAGTVSGISELELKINLIAILCRNARQELIVRIERPTNPKVFPRPGVSHGAMIKIARNVGMNYQKAEELGRFCEGLGIKVEFVEPARKKLNAKQVREITGYLGRTSSHSRDALMIAIRKGI
jgi:hypothetical protein